MKSFVSHDLLDKYIKETEAFFIDFDGTIVDYLKSEKQALADVFSKAGVQPDIMPEVISRYSQVNIELWKRFEQDEITVEVIKHQRFQTILDEFSLHGDPSDFNNRYLKKFVEFVSVIPQSIDGLHLLKQHFPDIPRIIVTNGTDTTQKERIAKLKIKLLITGMVTSDGVGYSKPSKEIFLAAQKISKRPLTNTWMIGDSLSSDIKGAHNAGLKSCLISSSYNGELEDHPSIVVNSFYEFCQYFVSQYRK